MKLVKPQTVEEYIEREPTIQLSDKVKALLNMERGDNIDTVTEKDNISDSNSSSSSNNKNNSTTNNSNNKNAAALKSPTGGNSSISSKFLEAAKFVDGTDTTIFSSHSNFYYNRLYFENCLKNDFTEIEQYFDTDELEMNEINTNEWFLFNKLTKQYQNLSIKPFDLLQEANKTGDLDDSALSLQLFNATTARENPS